MRNLMSRRRRRLYLSVAVAALSVLIAAAAVWVGAKASLIAGELNSAAKLIEPLKAELAANQPAEAAIILEELKSHTGSARKAARDPLWTLSSTVPGLGANVRAVTEVARTADDVTLFGLEPLVETYSSLSWNSLIPGRMGTNLEPLRAASPSVISAAHAVRASTDRLNSIDTGGLVPQVLEPLTNAREELGKAAETLDVAANVAQIGPSMLGVEGPRRYLLVIQNSAESRASGGIPGALAVLTLDRGHLELVAQGSAGDVGIMSPVLKVDEEQRNIYSTRLGKFFQDVNLTPDFPTAAANAQQMWERTTGDKVDGVISVDPIVLGFILDATGPIGFRNPEIAALASGSGLPMELSGHNVVQSLLSDVYAKIEDPRQQDAFFAGVAKEIFVALSDGKGDAVSLLSGITRGVEEGRILIWSNSSAEQSIISAHSVSGAVAGPSVLPAQFGIYFNDGTGAKMDYYVKRTVQLIKECPKDGYEQTTVRVTSTNTAPADAAVSLPAYVTGNGVFGVPPGSVQTNIVAYGPVQAQVETAKLDGQKTEFAPYLHSNRPVGVLAIRLAPGESKTVDFTFGKIVQHAEPNVVVTPTVQDVKDVTLPTETVACG